MNKAAKAQADTAKGKEEMEAITFRETFKPKVSHVNFGALKNEKREPQKAVKRIKVKKRVLAIIIAVVLIVGAGIAAYCTGYLKPSLIRTGLVSGFQGQPDLEIAQALEKQKEELDSREQELNDREKSLDERERALEAKQSETGDSETLMLGSQTFRQKMEKLDEDKLSDLKRVSAIYNNMAPKQAAAILISLYDQTELAAIIYYMQPKVSAQVLQQMEPKTAAGITELLIN